MRLSLKVLIVLLGVCSVGFAQCKKIVAETIVTHTQNGSSNGKIVLEIKDSRKEDFSISLFGPRAQNKIKIDKTEIDRLSKGKYLIVVVGKREDDNYCPRSIEVIVN